jgi:hypothetical protein
VKKESSTFTVGYDQTVKGVGQQEDIFCISNPNKVLYTSICWDEEEKLLYMADELGFIYIANVYMGLSKFAKWKSRRLTFTKTEFIGLYSASPIEAWKPSGSKLARRLKILRDILTLFSR